MYNIPKADGCCQPPCAATRNAVDLYYIYYTILYYTILYYTILYYTILYYTMPFCNKCPNIYYNIKYYSML